jgi:hypothetical protein
MLLLYLCVPLLSLCPSVIPVSLFYLCVPPGTLLYLREGVRSGGVVQEICLLRVLK